MVNRLNACARTAGLIAAAVIAFGGLLAGTLAAQPSTLTRTREQKTVVPYRITRGDKIAVAIFGEADLTAGNKRVDGATGTVNLTLIGDVRVHGLTVSEAAQAIANAYIDGRILRKPEVTVTVEEYAPRTVSVTGKVKYPSTVNLPPEEQWTIKDVIMKVGGFEDTARGTGVILTRTMPDGSPKSITLDVQSALVGRDKTKSNDATFIVEPGDHIHVPEKLI